MSNCYGEAAAIKMKEHWSDHQLIVANRWIVTISVMITVPQQSHEPDVSFFLFPFGIFYPQRKKKNIYKLSRLFICFHQILRCCIFLKCTFFAIISLF